MKNEFRFKIEKMHCASCATQIEQAISKLKGVKKAKVNFANETAIAEVDPSFPSPLKDILTAVKKIGYEMKVIEAKGLKVISHEAHHHAHSSPFKALDLWIAIIFTLPLVTHMFVLHVPSYLQLVCATIVQFWSGRHFYKAAWESLKHFHGNMDLLVTLGTSVAYFYSVGAIFLQSPALYFEASAVVITLVLLGRLLEDQAKESANSAVKSLVKLLPHTALVKRDGAYVEISSHDIKKGDSVMVKAWQRIPVDGVIEQGLSEVDESMITGESTPVLKEKGNKVIGGTTNTSGVLFIRATGIGAQSTLSRMIRMVENAQSSHPPIQKFVDRVSEVFIPVVLFISLLTFIGWLVAGSTFQYALLASISVLVIACPCALGLATPMAIVVSMGEAARKGILIKDLESLEVLRRVDTVVFDKTGTLTKGEFTLRSSESHSSLSRDEIVLLSASLQKGSEHPIAKAFLKAAKGKKLLKVEDFVSLPGKGVQGKIKDTVYFLGSARLMGEHRIQITPPSHPEKTIIYLAKEGHLLGTFYLADTLRKKAKETLMTLRNMGLKTVMLSGDTSEIAHSIGNAVDIDEVRAQLQPIDKINYINSQIKNGHSVAMVGDGVNDGPALAAATVGFAMGSGTDVAIDAASITLMRPALDLVPQAFLLSQKTFRRIQENLFWAFIFNIVGIGLAAFGELTPEIAGGAMAASSLFVVINSLRLKVI